MKYKGVYILFFKTIILAIIVMLGFIFMESFFSKDQNFGEKSWTYFYKNKKNSINTLFFGNSHIYNGVSGDILDAKLGSKTYTISSPSQAIYQTYFNIKEALKHQTPSLVVVETYSLQERNITVKGFKKINSGKAYLKKLQTISNKSFGLTKLEEAYQLYNQDYLNVIFPGVRYHNDWTKWFASDSVKLKSEKFEDDYNGNFFHKSILSKENIAIYKSGSINPITKNFELVLDEELYVNKIISLCKSKNIDVLFITLPFYSEYLNKFKDDYEKHKSNLVNTLDKEGVKYYDFNSSQSVLDNTYFANDKAGRNQHLNYKGAIKISEDLVELMLKLYPDKYKKTENSVTSKEGLIYSNNLNYNPGDVFSCFVGRINKSLDKSITITGDTLEINGWMVVEGEESTYTEKYIALVNDSFKYINLPSQMVVNLSRKEVSKRFDVVKLYDDSGFKLAMDTRFLEKGEYFLVAITKDKRGVVRSKKLNRKIIID